MSADPCPAPLQPRRSLRDRLLTERALFAASCERVEAERALARELRAVLADLEPQCIGHYWPLHFEFNAATALADDEEAAKSARALPFARRSPREMHYRAWNGLTPALVDECGIPTADGAPVVPDVVLVPCVGYTESGFRLGYGGGYFDRWLAAHPHVCAVGVAWSAAKMGSADFAPMAHDVRLALIVTERGAI